jgi:thiol-disulfide isomerase/thioredoxin
VKAQLTITGKLTPSVNWESKFYIARIDKIGLVTPQLIDSVRINADGTFAYTFDSSPQGVLFQFSQPCKGCNYLKTISGLNENSFLVISNHARSEKLKLEGNSDSLFYSVKMTGSELNSQLLIFRNLRYPIAKLLRQTNDLRSTQPEQDDKVRQQTMKSILQQTELIKSRLHAILDTCQTPPLLAAGIYYLNEAYFGQLQPEQISPYISRLPESEIILYRNLKNNNLATSKSKAGLVLPNTTLVDSKGKHYPLYKIPGKYKIIDFWASWCGPCRKANTGQLRALYSKLHKYKIPIIGISIDKDVNKWKEAVKKDNTPWLQVMEVEPLLGKIIQPDMEGIPLYLVIDENNLVVLEARAPAQIEFFLKERISDF